MLPARHCDIAGAHDAFHKVALGNEEDHEGGDHADDRAGHQQGPLRVELALQEGQAQGHRHVLFGAEEDQWPQQIVPGSHEGEHGQGGQRRSGER